VAWGWALTKVPWRALLAHAPTLVDAARRFRRPAREPERTEAAAGDVEALKRAVQQLREREGQQAALLDELAKQAREMAIALEVLHARLRFALIGAALALGLAILALVLGR
jgi:hypothetical protein